MRRWQDVRLRSLKDMVLQNDVPQRSLGDMLLFLALLTDEF